MPKEDIYLLVVDYYSCFPEVTKLSLTLSSSVITVLKSLFARYGIPEIIQSNHDPQYSSSEFTQVTKAYGVVHIISSPRYPQSNGEDERMSELLIGDIRNLPDIQEAQEIYESIPAGLIQGPIAWTPRSYIVETPAGEICRNKGQPHASPKLLTHPTEQYISVRSSPIQTHSRTGVVLQAPERLY